MVQHDKVASVYAKAFFDSLGDNARAKKLAEDLTALNKIFSKNEELIQVFRAAGFSQAQRNGIIEDLAKAMGMSPEAKSALRVLSEGRRVGHMGPVASALRGLVLDAEGIIPIEVESAKALSGEEKAKLEKEFKALLGKPVEANFVENPALLGGLRATAAGHTYNGSLAGWLNVFEERLVGG